MEKSGTAGIDSQKLYDNAHDIASKFYRFYKMDFILNAVDLDDLKQEASIVVFKLLEKHGNIDAKVIEKLVNISVGRQMRKLRLKCLVSLHGDAIAHQIINKHTITSTNTKDGRKITIEKNAGYDDNIEIFDIYSLDLDDLYNLVDSKTMTDFIHFEELKSIVSDKEYEIICKKFIDNMTFEYIGQTLGISKQAVFKMYNKAIRTIKEILKKEME